MMQDPWSRRTHLFDFGFQKKPGTFRKEKETEVSLSKYCLYKVQKLVFCFAKLRRISHDENAAVSRKNNK